VLLQHPKVADAAVFGIPDDDAGEQIKATVQPAEGVEVGPELEQELIAFCLDNLAKYKVPRSIDFLDDFPRTATGKLLKRKLRDPYWAGRTSQLV
jgi:long-chain acyl-CoA synthetase